jgi:hypothetical protein
LISSLISSSVHSRVFVGSIVVLAQRIECFSCDRDSGAMKAAAILPSGFVGVRVSLSSSAKQIHLPRHGGGFAQTPECVGGNAAPNKRAGRFKVIFRSRTRAKLAADPTVIGA